jgi:cell division protein FtsQ
MAKASAKSVKNKPLTKRQQQSQKIAREKAAKKMFRSVYHRVMLVGGLVLSLNLLVAGWWFWYAGHFDRVAENIRRGIDVMTADAGFTLETVYLEGRHRTPLEKINMAIGVKRGDSILSISVEEMRQRLELLEHVKEAAVERSLPDTLYVRIVEREPVAIWQHDGVLMLVDDEGQVMEGENIASYHYLPLVVGEEAPEEVSGLLKLLALEPDLAPRIKAVVRVGARRWNVKFDKGVEVKLPEEAPVDAWKALARMQREQRVLDRDIRAIDMRVKDRIFIKVSPDLLKPEQQTLPAKET